MSRRTCVVGLALLLGLSGCVGGPVGKCLVRLGLSRGPVPATAPVMGPVTAPPPGVAGCTRPQERLTLRRALWLAYIYNPDLAAFSYEMRVRDAKMLQAGLKPNPELTAELENFAGDGDSSGTESAETTITLSQLIPLGGKIPGRVAVAGLDRDLAWWDYQAKRVEVMKEVAVRFVATLVAQEKLKLARRKIALAEEVYDVANKRFSAGDTSVVDRTRARAELATSRIGLQRRRYDLMAARQALAAMWGSTEPKFAYAEGDLGAVRRVPPFKVMTAMVMDNPAIVKWTTEMSKRWAEFRLAKAERIPDLTAGIGVRRINQPLAETPNGGTVPVPNETALVAALSLPLPIFDRNQGNIGAAHVNLAKGEQERRAAWVRIRTALALSYNALISAYREAAAIRRDVLPALRSAYEGIRKGYRQGKNGYIDLLAAQKSLIDERERYIETLGEYHNALARIEALIGTPVGGVARSFR